MSSEDPKLVFQLTQQGDLLEVRLAAPGGECRAETQPPSSAIPAQMAAFEQTAVPETTLAGIGQTLYSHLVSGDAAELVAETLHSEKNPGVAVHFELRFDPDQAALAQFPWETIADPSGRFLVRDGVVSLTRYITYPQPPAPFDVALDRQPLLRVIARPSGLPSVAAGDLGIARLESLEHATFEALQQKLLIQRLAAWGMHFDGHGGLMLRCRKCKSLEPPGTSVCAQCNTSLSNASALGVLIFERNGGYDLITTEELGSVLYNADVRFALLSACESANVAGSSLFNGLAPGLMMAGVPAVIGMQYRISDDFASSFAIKFYSALLQRKDVVEALTVARAMLLRSAWYSPALYLRQHRAADERRKATYETRNIDTVAPAEAQTSKPFLVRLWIRRPETTPLTEEQLRAELGVPNRVAVSTRAGEADVRFEPVGDRKLRRGEVLIRLTSPACEVVPASIKLFVDEHVDAPPAIFTVKAIQPGPAALIFSVWQDGGQIASISHQVQAVDAGKRPRTGISARSHVLPVQTPTPPSGEPRSRVPRALADSAVNLRSGPGEAYPVVGELGAGQEVDILGRNASGDWWRLAWPGGKQAWVAGTAITILPPIDNVMIGKSIPAPSAPAEATAVTPKPLPPITAPAAQPRHDLRRWLGLVALLWVVAGLATPLPILTAFRLNSSMGASLLPEPPALAVSQNTLCLTQWPTLIIVFVAVQIIAASVYWRNRASHRLGRWLPATLLVGFLSLLVGLFIAIAIVFLLL
jgi:hypothetical protein